MEVKCVNFGAIFKTNSQGIGIKSARAGVGWALPQGTCTSAKNIFLQEPGNVLMHNVQCS